MSKLVLKTVLATAVASSLALAADINLSAKSAGSNSVNAAPGASVPFQIEATLTGGASEGLALIGFDLDFTGGNLAANTLTAPVAGVPSCASPMPNFVKNLGITNPAGYLGTLIGGDLIQIGGGQNTINNVQANAEFPVGVVIPQVAKGGATGCPPNGPAIVAVGSLTAPMANGVYTLEIENVFANVIRAGETGVPFWATEAAGVGMVTNLTITVQDTCATPAITRWDSVLTHSRTGTNLGPIALEITADNNFSEPRQGMRKIVVTFNSAINPATAIPANVTIVGRDVNQQLLNLAGIAVSVAPTAGNTGLEINFNPPLPNFARYRVNLNNVTASCGGAPITTNNQRIFTALLGDVTNNRNVQANDPGGARGLIPVGLTALDPINPAIINQVRSDANLDARINAADVGGIRSQVGNNASAITNP
jgi:hypothetical protein